MEISKYISKDKCTKTEVHIYNFLDANDYSLCGVSAEIIAKKCNCSMSSITRFFQKCGFDGFSEFKHFINNNSFQSSEYFNHPNLENDYLLFAKQIKHANIILIFGFGSSHITAQYLYHILLRLDYNVRIITDRYDLQAIKHDCSIIISNSGETRAISSLLSSDYDQRKILAITKANSTLYKHSRVALCHNICTIDEHSFNHDEQIHLLLTTYELIKILKQEFH
ncbi:MAG: MurR/RpiR family transcriptional regulator [Mycoplasmatales bacterium]